MAGLSRGCAQSIEYLAIRFQEFLKSFRDSTFDLVRRQTSRSLALARRVLNGILRDVVAIPSSALDRKRRGEAIPFPIFDQTRQQARGLLSGTVTVRPKIAV